MSFRDLEGTLKGVYTAEDNRLSDFYAPVLKEAVTYDRISGFFSSSALALASQSLSHFIAGGGMMRLIVGSQLSRNDVNAMLEGQSLPDILSERLLSDPLQGADVVSRHRLQTLAYLYKHNRLKMRIGVPVDKEGNPLPERSAAPYFHSKYGIFTDSNGDRIAFLGSDNETALGRFRHHETFCAFKSWKPEAWSEWGAEIARLFEAHWNGAPDRGWQVMELPEAVEARLIDLAPPEPPPPVEPEVPETPVEPTTVDERLKFVIEAPSKDGGTGVGFETSGVEPWPHQLAIAKRAVVTYPRSYLLADEVGLGKTIEAGLILRELMVSAKARTALFLVPASVLRQWQEELFEKFALRIPRYSGGNFLDVYTDEEMPCPEGNPWCAYPVVLASSHLAKRRDRREQLLAAAPWDVVFLDEAHHARRRGSTDTPNLLLSLMQELKQREAWKALYLASATPMQMNPQEAWDLLALLGLTSLWGHSADNFVRYFSQLRESSTERDWEWLSRMVRDHFEDKSVHPDPKVLDTAKERLGFAGSFFFRQIPAEGIRTRNVHQLDGSGKAILDEYLRENNPMRDRVFRTTRRVLRRYKEEGRLAQEIPLRRVRDEFIDMTETERAAYDRIETYISRYYNFFTTGPAERKPLGFIMTVYRRRLTSSFYAIQESLQRRLRVLQERDALSELLDEDDRMTLETRDPEDALIEDMAPETEQEITELAGFLRDLKERPQEESKLQQLHKDLNSAFQGRHDTAIVFTQYADTMEYLSERLKQTYGSRVVRYSGSGGQRWDPARRSWLELPKHRVRELFREGREVKILIGTDSLSEGLNLQTCARLINYDVPWNFMRVEQRIGRVDRIGGQPEVEVTNYFYKDTVEEQIYRGIQEDVDWFEDVVGPAQPVLNEVEQAIESAAMLAPGANKREEISRGVQKIRERVEEAESRPVTIDSFESTPSLEQVETSPIIDLLELETLLTQIPATAKHLKPHPEIEGSYLLMLHDQEIPVTFQRKLYAEHVPKMKLLTYASNELKSLLEMVGVPGSDAMWTPNVPSNRGDLRA